MLSLVDKCGIPVDLAIPQHPPDVGPKDVRECLESPDVVCMARPKTSRRDFWYYRGTIEVAVSYNADPSRVVRPVLMSTASCRMPASPGELQWRKEAQGPSSAVDIARFAWAVNRRPGRAGGVQAARPAAVQRIEKLRWEVVTPVGRVQASQRTWERLCTLVPRLSDQRTEEAVKRVLRQPHRKPKPEPRYHEPPGYLFYQVHGHEEAEVVVGTSANGVLVLEAVVFVPAGHRDVRANLIDRRGIPISVNRETWRRKVAKHPELALAYPFIQLALQKPIIIAREKSPDGLDFMLYFPPDVMTRLLGPPEQVGGWLFVVLAYSINTRARVRADFKTGYVNGFWNHGKEEARWNLRE